MLVLIASLLGRRM